MTDFNPFDPTADDPVDLEWPEGLIRPTSPPYLVYLDLNHWIGLAQANTGNLAGERYIDVLAAARAAHDAGSVAFPLSGTHYMEIAKITRRRWRADLASIMEELSGFITLVCRSVVMRLELETALDHRFGRFTPRLGPVELLGFGVHHSIGIVPSISFGSDPDDATHESERWRNLRLLDRLPEDWRLGLERSVLAGPQDDRTEARLRADGWRPDAALETARSRAKEEAEQAGRLDADPRWRAGRLRDVVGAREVIIELLDTLIYALRRRHLDISGLFDDRAAARQFAQCMPSMTVATEMKTRNHRSRDSKWDSNTTFDIDAMALAVPYCDAVVTERHACDTLNIAKVGDRMGTTIMATPAELLAWLEALERTE
jgi:hypothetical protein